MVTDVAAIHTPLSEITLFDRKPLHPNFDLHSDEPALWVEGIGHLAQYDCYCDKLFSHGVVYFVRDCLIDEIEALLEQGTPTSTVRERVQRLNALNSKIKVHETCQSPESSPPPLPGPTTTPKRGGPCPAAPHPAEPSAPLPPSEPPNASSFP
jgi:hypothetical protein